MIEMFLRTTIDCAAIQLFCQVLRHLSGIIGVTNSCTTFLATKKTITVAGSGDGPNMPLLSMKPLLTPIIVVIASKADTL